jgi:hypothetical protein
MHASIATTQRRYKFFNFTAFKMGLVLATEGGLHQTETYTPSGQCVEANGAGGWASNYGKWTNKSAVG